VIVVTGSELVRGDVRDRNGPFLAREALRLGLDPARIQIVGDRVDELEDALRDGLRADLCVVSGGLGPTHDDRTIELLARAAGRGLRVDGALVEEIGGVSRAIAERLKRPYADFQPGVVKQATLPEGGVSLGLAGTAPGVLLELDGRVAIALPGPPPELQRLWARSLETEPVRRLLARAAPPRLHRLRFFGVSESAVARALADAGGERKGVEATICARDFEIHVDLIGDDGELEVELASRLERYMYARGETSIEQVVLDLCRARGLTLATAESCTGGMIAERLTGVPGSSDVFAGAIVAYADAVKVAKLGVPEPMLAQYGAVSAEAAEAMAAGARRELGVDVAIAATGVAGPGGGTAEKPVGLVYLNVAGSDGARAEELRLWGDRDAIRRRATVTALHLVRRLLRRT
jgi:nicotinamide-nucleotide amidase